MARSTKDGKRNVKPISSRYSPRYDQLIYDWFHVCCHLLPETTLEYRQFSAWIKIDGSRTRVYCVEKRRNENSPEKVITGYIASEPNKAFSIHWNDNLRSSTTFGRVAIEGHKLGGEWIDSWDHLERQGALDPIGNTRTLDSFRSENFYFKEMQTTDDDAYLDQAPNPLRGTIELRLKRSTKMTWDVEQKKSKPVAIKKKGKVAAPKEQGNMAISDGISDWRPLDDAVVHETSVKAGGHCFQLGSTLSQSQPLMGLEDEEDDDDESDDGSDIDSTSGSEQDTSSDYEPTVKAKCKPEKKCMWTWNQSDIVFRFLFRPRARLELDGIIPPRRRNSSTPSNQPQSTSHKPSLPEPTGTPEPASTALGSLSLPSAGHTQEVVPQQLRGVTPALVADRRSPSLELEYVDDPLQQLHVQPMAQTAVLQRPAGSTVVATFVDTGKEYTTFNSSTTAVSVKEEYHEVDLGPLVPGEQGSTVPVKLKRKLAGERVERNIPNSNCTCCPKKKMCVEVKGNRRNSPIDLTGSNSD